MNRVTEGFEQRSPAICVVAYDVSGAPVSEEIAERILKAVEEVTKDEKLAINYTRS